MASAFEVIADDFIDDMEAIRSLVVTFSDPQKTAKARIAAANSATLLVAATFEEFIREMARQFARSVVAAAPSFDKLPAKIAATAWKRTMDSLAKVRFESAQSGAGRQNIFGAAQARFTVIYEFFKGDLTQDIYRDLIHNENNMRPAQLNGLFSVSGLSDVCKQLSDRKVILDSLGETEAAVAHGRLLALLEDFFERRNGIAHSLNPGQSSGPIQIIKDIDLLESFGRALSETLDIKAPHTPILPSQSDTVVHAVSSFVPPAQPL